MLPPVIAGAGGSAESLAAAMGVAPPPLRQWGRATREAVRRDRPLRLAHTRNRHPCQGAGEPETAAQQYLARCALRQAEDRIRRTCPAVELDDDQIEGPVTTVLLQAGEQAARLVLGSRGLSGLTGFPVGSVARGVVARAVWPVVLVRADEDAADEHLPADNGSPSSRTGHRDVVLGIDLGDPCDEVIEVIEVAFEAARLRRARPHIVHAWQALSPIGLGTGGIGRVDGSAQADEWLGFMTAVLQVWQDKYPEVVVAETVSEGRAQSVLVRAGAGGSPLVVGRRTTERPTGPRTGPVTHAAIHHAGCPVAVVPHE
ncbi:universal stress protein [Streptomyces caeruleatus]|uniref:Stress protein n=1 Tax=Streptomyces caeruleatus TaxID=661399 RepID=A0A101U946_9ACTN|nr:universal stress protein [Streptomyces caeruleatus]KUO06226.1 stress protein [Streptomyces caeruleatus]